MNTKMLLYFFRSANIRQGMKKYPLLLIVLICTAVIVGAVFLSRKGQPKSEEVAESPPGTLQYYWSKTCPHCTKVAEFLEGWDKKDQLEMEKFEINESSENRLKFYKMGMFCNISRDELGVPFLITPEGKCYIGDEPIIEYFKGLYS